MRLETITDFITVSIVGINGSHDKGLVGIFDMMNTFLLTAPGLPKYCMIITNVNVRD